MSPAGGGSEYVQGLTYKECATLLNVDVANSPLMEQIYETAYNIKERIYGNRIVLFAPLYIANHCVNNCAYCAFRADNKNIAVRGRFGGHYAFCWTMHCASAAMLLVPRNEHGMSTIFYVCCGQSC